MLTNVWTALTVMSGVNTLLTDHQLLWPVGDFSGRYGSSAVLHNVLKLDYVIPTGLFRKQVTSS